MSRHTQVASRSPSASRTGLSPAAAPRSRGFRPLPVLFMTLLLPRHMPSDTAGLGSSPFARRYWGNRSYFLFLRVLRCFSSPRSPRADHAVSGSLPTGCPIRTSGGRSAFATRPGFSQLVTSFFASESLGIPHAPFFVPLSLHGLFTGPFITRTEVRHLFAFGLLVFVKLVVFLLFSRDTSLFRNLYPLPALSMFSSESSPWQS